MNPKYFKFIGQKFGRLTIQDFTFDTDIRESVFICLCDCGKVRKLQPYLIFDKRYVSCGCYNWGTEFITENIILQFYSKIKTGAKDRDIEVAVTPEYLEEVWKSQNGLCYFSKVEITLPKTGAAMRRGNFSASVDRLDNTKGYIKGNVCFVHKTVNLMKGSLTVERFIDWCSKITVFRG